MSDQSPATRAASVSQPPARGGSSTGAGACPPSGLLAAYVDGTLNDAAHREIQAHLVECGDCLEVVAEASVGRAELADGSAAESPVPHLAARPDSARVVSIRDRRRWFWPAAGVLAAAALIVVAVVVPRLSGPRSTSSDRPELAELVAAVGEHRPFEPRLTGGFKYGPLAPVMRSGEGQAYIDVPLEVRLAAAKVEKTHENDTSVQAVSAIATARLLLGRPDEAIGLLAEASRRAPESAPVWNDLAAASLVRAARRGSTEDVERGLDAANRALRIDPALAEACFNRGLALERLGRIGDASIAWQSCLERDGASPWAADLRQRLSPARRTP